MEGDWRREYEAMARTLRQAQVYAADGSGSPPSEAEWNQVLGALARAAAMPQLDKTVRDLHEELGLAMRIPDAFNAYWNPPTSGDAQPHWQEDTLTPRGAYR
eukprot:1428081-Pyramimonas_sp.AAC.1